LDPLFANIHTTVKPIDACADFSKYAGACEKQWADKITVAWRKEQFLAIWGFVRLELARYLKVSPEGILFDRTAYGKPFIKSPAINFSFNISHTKNHVALCYGKDVVSCGIDIEILRDMSDMLPIARRFYAKEEFLFLKSLESKEEQKYYFFKLWVIKEALLKTLGKGLSYGLDKVFIEGFENQMEGVIELVCDQQNKKLAWRFFEKSDADYFKAVAVEA
jgi:phosphopantetheine--protein transferase-like protein